MDVNIIKRHIMTDGYTNQELNEIAEAVRYARAGLIKSTARKLAPGVAVEFKDRRGQVYRGTVVSIKIKNAVVNTAQGRYRVPMNMLEVA
jgi:hypothetical protein